MVTVNIDHMPIEGNDWQQWRARIWNQIRDAFGAHPGLAPLEQWMLRSKRERRCIDCGEPGSVQQQSVIVPSVPHYWLCAGCDAYYREKGGEEHIMKTASEYIDSERTACRRCGSEALLFDNPEINQKEVSQRIDCEDCDAAWHDVYALRGYVFSRPEDEADDPHLLPDVAQVLVCVRGGTAYVSTTEGVEAVTVDYDTDNADRADLRVIAGEQCTVETRTYNFEDDDTRRIFSEARSED